MRSDELEFVFVLISTVSFSFIDQCLDPSKVCVWNQGAKIWVWQRNYQISFKDFSVRLFDFECQYQILLNLNMIQNYFTTFLYQSFHRWVLTRVELLPSSDLLVNRRNQNYICRRVAFSSVARGWAMGHLHPPTQYCYVLDRMGFLNFMYNIFILIALFSQ